MPLGARQPTGPEAPRRCAGSTAPAVAPAAASAFPKRARTAEDPKRGRRGGLVYFTPLHVCGIKGALEADPGESTTAALPAPRAMLGVGKAALPPPANPPSGLEDDRDKSSPISATGPGLLRPQEAMSKARTRPEEPLRRQSGFGAPSSPPPAEPSPPPPLRACPEPRKSPQLPAAPPGRLPWPVPPAGSARLPLGAVCGRTSGETLRF